MQMACPDSFHILAFTADGELVGRGQWSVRDLSPKWLRAAQSTLSENGPIFRLAPVPAIGHIELKLTIQEGCGLGSFFASGELVASTAYFTGASPAAEAELRDLFIGSLSKPITVRVLDREQNAFAALDACAERPLHAVVVWGNPIVSEADQHLVRELANHFAGAILCEYTSGDI